MATVAMQYSNLVIKVSIGEDAILAEPIYSREDYEKAKKNLNADDFALYEDAYLRSQDLKGTLRRLASKPRSDQFREAMEKCKSTAKKSTMYDLSMAFGGKYTPAEVREKMVITITSYTSDAKESIMWTESFNWKSVLAMAEAITKFNHTRIGKASRTTTSEYVEADLSKHYQLLAK